MSEPNVDQLISVDQAIAIIDQVMVAPQTCEMRIDDPVALGSVIAQDVISDRDYPPFDRALMDGFAVRSDDRGLRRNVGEIAAGAAHGEAINAGECIAIMTGAPVPRGADAVVPIELIDKRGNEIVVPDQIKRGHNISPRGSDCAANTQLIEQGSIITPVVLAVLATVGASRVRVVAKLRVGVLSTGSEVIAFDQTPLGAQIRNSNNLLLRSLVTRLGCDAIDLGHVIDDPKLIESAIASAGVDVLLITGGMSMGEYDYVPRVLKKLNYELPITKLKIKPGKPFVMATKSAGDGPNIVFGLPGNPVSGYVCTVRLVSRLLNRMAGKSPEPKWLSATLDQDLPANGPREFYQPAKVSEGHAAVFSWKGSADLFTLSKANALLVRAANESAKLAGDSVRLLEVPQ